MHEDIQRWDIRPKFPIHTIILILIGALGGFAFGIYIENLLFGLVLGLIIGAATGLAWYRVKGEGGSVPDGRLRLWALVPLVGFVTVTVLLWIIQFIIV